mgnify:FL=1
MLFVGFFYNNQWKPRETLGETELNIENPISKTTENIIEEENPLKEKMKFIAMNRFKIVPNREKDFENIWKNRETHLNDVSGFIEFHLVKGNSEETHTVYASHSTWNSRKDFEVWTKSEAFRQAHKGAGEHSSIYLGHPEFEGFEV